MTPSRDDSAKPNGSSIALLAEFGGRSAVLAGDAFPDVLAAALSRLAELRAAMAWTCPCRWMCSSCRTMAGSQANVTLPLLAAVKAEHYVFSTSGARFRHPDQAAVARVITRGGPDHTLWFNYANTRTRRWDKAEWKASHAYRTRYPEQAGGGDPVPAGPRIDLESQMSFELETAANRENLRGRHRPVSRVEGHGKVTLLLDEAGHIHEARLHIVEFRVSRPSFAVAPTGKCR